VRHGYYLSARNLLRGDRPLALEAQAFYRGRLGLDSKYAQPYDGVSIYSRPDGKLVVRAVLQNFFAENLDVRVHDYPYEPTMSDRDFICGECGGVVKMVKPDGDFREVVKGGSKVYLPIPATVLIPKCTYCGETYFGQSDVDRIEAALGADH
jgi:hypothetical protein